MFDWMYQSREEFLINYFDIGSSFGLSKELQEDHKCFSLSSMVSLYRSTQLEELKCLD